MRLILNMKTRKKLYLRSVIWLTLLALIFFGAYSMTAGMAEEILLIYNEHFVAAQGAAELKSDFNGVRTLLVNLMAEKDKARMEAINNNIKGLTKTLDDRFDALQGNKSFPKDMLDDLKKIHDVWTAFRETRDKEIIPAVLAGDLDKAKGLALGVQAERYKTFLSLANDFIKKESEEGHEGVMNLANFVNKTRNILIIVFIVLVISNFVMNKLILKAMIDPLSAGVTLAEAISTGDTTKKIDPAILDRDDEIGVLMQSLDKMSSSMNRFSTAVSLSSAKLVTASEKLYALSVMIEQGAADQTQKATQVATASEEMSATVTDVARNASDASDAALNASTVAKEGGEVVEKTVAGMHEIAESVKASATVIEQLGGKSREIGQIISVIDDIAGQTNLLALNAAIEAARAGEQGRGFAVVADEVRKLADRTSKATKEIGEMIASIQEDTGKAVSAMEENTKGVEAEVMLAKEAGGALKNIIASVDRVSGMIQQIATASEEQSTVAGQISGDIEAVAAVTKESSAGASEIAAAVADLATLAAALKDVVAIFKVSMTVNWSKELALAVDEIDTQHKELFMKINRFLDLGAHSQTKETLKEAFSSLEEYIRAHFNTEDKYMTKHNYQGRSAHNTEHEQFTRRFNDLKSKFEAADYKLSPEAVMAYDKEQLLGDWWIKHISTTDKALADFLKKKV